MRSDTHALDRFRNEIAGSHHVANAETRRELYIDLAGLKLGGCVLVVRAQASVADAVPSGFIGAARRLSDSLDGVCAGLRGRRRDGEEDRVGVAGCLAMEVGLGRIGAPAVGKFERDGAFGCGLCVDCDTDRKRAAVEGQDAGLRLDADTDGWRDDERLVDAAGAGDTLQGLHDFADANGEAVEGELGPCVERLRSEGAIAPRRIGDVVVGLLDVGAGEEGCSWRALSGTWT